MNTILYILIPAFLIVLYLIFRNYARPGNIRSLTGEERKLLLENVEFYQLLQPREKIRYENKIAAFLAEVHMEGVGTDIDALDRLLVASSAVIPVFGFPDWRYKNLTNVLLYPDTFNTDFQFEGGSRNILGMVGTGYMNGQMVLSRSALHQGFSKHAGRENTGIHEFVHLLDKSDGATDGIPENLMKHEYTVPWIKMMHQEMQRIAQGKSDINPYAVTNEAEFFAVVSEYFFERPRLFKEKHPELYKMLADSFSQDLASNASN